MSDECRCTNLPPGDHFYACPQALHHRIPAMLRRLEWLYMERSGTHCPICGASSLGAPDHYPDCDLATLLRDLP